MADQYQPNGYQPYQGQPQYTPVQQQYSPQYQQPYPPTFADKTTEVMSIGSYLGVFFISMIPIVNFIAWIVWLVSSDTNKNKKNFIIASIIYSVIIAVIYGILVALLIAAGVFSDSALFNDIFNSFIGLL